MGQYVFPEHLYDIWMPGSRFLGSMFLQSQLAPSKVICQDYIYFADDDMRLSREQRYGERNSHPSIDPSQWAP